jgi:hypothetical protein
MEKRKRKLSNRFYDAHFELSHFVVLARSTEVLDTYYYYKVIVFALSASFPLLSAKTGAKVYETLSMSPS